MFLYTRLHGRHGLNFYNRRNEIREGNIHSATVASSTCGAPVRETKFDQDLDGVMKQISGLQDVIERLTERLNQVLLPDTSETIQMPGPRECRCYVGDSLQTINTRLLTASHALEDLLRRIDI